MKKSLLLLCAVLLLAWCSTPSSNQNLVDEETKNLIPDEVSVVAMEELMPFPLSEINVALSPDEPRVVKYANKGEYQIFTLDLVSEFPTRERGEFEQASCDRYGYSTCSNVIGKDGQMIWSHFVTNEERAEGSVGSFHQFTNDGAIFRYMIGEGGPCSSFFAVFNSYYNFTTQKMFYGVYQEFENWISPDPADEFCEHPDTERIPGTGRAFYPDYESMQAYFYYDFFGGVDEEEEREKHRLPLQSADIESAFYEYRQFIDDMPAVG